MANNDMRGRRVVDSKPVVRAPLDEYGFPHGAGNVQVLPHFKTVTLQLQFVWNCRGLSLFLESSN